MMDKLKNKRTLIVVIAVALVAILVAVIAFFVVKTNQPETIESKINNSRVGNAINEITTVNGEPAASIVIAPPTQKWWDTLLGYTTNPLMKDLSFDEYKTNAEYIAYTNSPGNSFEAQGVIGLPTTFIVYKAEADAQKVASLIDAKGGIGYQKAGNIIVFISDGAYSDVNYALQQYDNSKDRTDKAELNLNDEALMIFNFKSFTSVYAAGLSEDDYETVDTTLALLGMTNQTTWSGTSKDGLNWEGTFSNTDFNSPNTPSSIRDFLATRAYYLDIDGEIKLISKATENNQTGIQYPAQSVLIGTGSMSVRSNSEAVGVDSKGEAITALPASEGLYQVSIDVNRWLAVMRNSDVTYTYTMFKTLTVTALDTSGKSTIKLEPITNEEDYLNDGEATETPLEDVPEEVPSE